MRSVTRIGRVAALGAVIAAITLVAIVLFGGGSGSGYDVTAKFINAGQLVPGNPVQTGGAPIGTINDIRITGDGQAEVTFELDEAHAPLRRGTRATIRQFSLSGIANRYIELTLPPGGSPEIPDGGRIEIDETRTAVDLDQLFNTFDPSTGKALQDFLRTRPTSSAAAAPTPTRPSPTSTPRSRPRAGCSTSSPATSRCSSASWSTARSWSRRSPSAATTWRRWSATSTRPRARWATRRPRSPSRSSGCRRSCAAPTRRS